MGLMTDDLYAHVHVSGHVKIIASTARHWNPVCNDDDNSVTQAPSVLASCVLHKIRKVPGKSSTATNCADILQSKLDRM